MGKQILLLIVLILAVAILPAMISDYYEAPVASSGTYSYISGGMSAGVSGDDYISSLLPIGFTFSYCGADYNYFRMDTNGYINLGGLIGSSILSNDLSSDSVLPVIAPLWDDLTSNYMYYLTTGVAGSRVLTVEWQSSRWNYQSSATQYFQVQLYEGTNQIKLAYGPMSTPSSASATIGINCAPGGAGNFYSIQPGTTMAYSTTLSYNSISSLFGLGNGRIFTFNPAAATVPPRPAVIGSPADMAMAISPLTGLSWTTGGGLPSGYKVYMGTDNPPTNLANGIDVGNVTSYDPTGDLTISTMYYWQIVPYNFFGDAVGCPIWSFTTLNGQATLSSPANGAMEVSLGNPALSFASVDGASAYYLNLGTTPGGTDVLNHVSAVSPMSISGSILFNTTYYWSVFAVFPGQEVQSVEWQFTTTQGVPGSPNPATGSSNNDTMQRVLDWADMPGAQSWNISVGTTPGGYDIVHNAQCLTSSYTHPADWAFSTTYYWTVTMHAQDGMYIVTSPEWSFTTAAPIVYMTNGSRTVPVGIDYLFYDSGGPNYAYYNNENYVFTFNPSPENVLQAVFDWYVSETGYDVLNIYDGANTSGNLIGSYTGSNNPGTIISSTGAFTFVFHTDSSATMNGWAATIRNLSTAVSPNPALLTSPANAATNISPLATLNWSSGGGFPTGYRVYIGTDNPPTNFIDGWDVGSATSYDSPVDFSINTIYYWQVIPYNAYGVATDCPVWSFSTINGQTALVTPAQSATGITVQNTAFAFDAVPGATGYFLNLGTSSGGEDVLSHTAVTPSWNSSVLLNFNTTYYWSVLTAFPGQEVPSAQRSFTTTSGMPTDPNPYDTFTGLDVIYRTLDWADVPGAAFYTITIGTTPGGSNVANSIQCPTSSYTHPADWSFTTTYYWTVTMHSVGDTYQIASPEWTFTTGIAVVNMTTGSRNVPDGVIYNFYDSGGANGAYYNYENNTFTFYPLPGRFLMVNFTYFSTENSYDYLRVYDGESIYAPALHAGSGFNGSYSPGSFNSSGPVTFVFTSDGSVTYSGWHATIQNSDYGVLEGTVSANGTGLANALLTVSEAGLSVTSNLSGFYQFPLVHRGSYNLIINKVGFVSQTLPVAVEPVMTTTANAALTPLPQLLPASINMNSSYITPDLTPYFDDSNRSMTYSAVASAHISWTNNGNDTLTLTPQTGWFGVEYITIRGTASGGDFAERTLRVTVLETWTSLETFNNAGSLPTGWTQTHSGTTTFPWQAILVSGADYALKTTAPTGTTANERLVSTAYNLTNYKDITISYNCSFLPYGTGTATLAYTLNNTLYTVIETLSSAFNGTKSYTLPILDGKPNVKFRWSYTNTVPNSGQSNYWTLDNFQVFGMVKDITPPAVITGLAVVSQTYNSALVSWQPTTDVYFNRYELYISEDATVTTSDRLWSVSNDAGLYNIAQNQTNITSLLGTTYWLAIRAIDSSNNASALSSAISFTIDATPPVINNPVPAGQPAPDWANNHLVTIGCSITDLNLINTASIRYRFDKNGNGVYDTAEVWTNYSRPTRDNQNISLQVLADNDGIHAFEFQAADIYGNVTYSGSSSQLGIADDWIVRIDTSQPVLTNSEQPLPSWSNSRTVILSCTVSHTSQIDTSSLRYRFDRNGNGIYDADEVWTALNRENIRSSSRDVLSISTSAQYATDGVLAFEFKATGMNGITGFSGSSGQEGIADDWIVRIDASAPQSLTNFYVQSIADTSIELKWTAVTDLNFAGYEVYYSTNPAVTTADQLWNKVTDPQMEFAGTGLVGTTITGLQPARRYYFLLLATDIVGNISQYPVIINAMTTSSAIPSTPEQVSLQIEGNNVRLTWDEVTTDVNANTIAISYYDIYAGETPDFECNPDNLIGTSLTPEFLLEDVTGTLYLIFFKIKAVSGSIRH